MARMARVVERFVSDESGLETVEYAIIAGIIVAASVASIIAIGVWVAAKFAALETALGA